MSDQMVAAIKVVVVGQGYVGLPVAMRAVAQGFNVVGLDLDKSRVMRLAGGDSYIDDISDEELQAALDSTRYLPSSDYADAADFDVAVITVPTPLRESLPDLSFIEGSAKSLAPHMRRHSTVILESTTYPGTTEELLVPALEKGSGLRAGIDFHVGYSPERIDPGNKTWGFVETPKVVSGIDGASLEKVNSFYSQLVRTTVPVSSPKEAELTKLLENTFRHVNIALVNELAIFAHQLGVNVWEAIEAASTKPFGFMKFTPGPGVGGHCLPVDPSYLSWQVRRKLGQNFRFVELANDINDHMPDYVVQRLMSLLNAKSKAIRGSRIGLLGLAYKRNTGDIRESPSLRIIEVLRDYGAEVYAVDSHVGESHWPDGVVRAQSQAELLDGADAVVVVTDHDEFDFASLGEGEVPVLDTRNRVRGSRAEAL
ncbi:nucleotide sugar dehydrogenase [Salinibacterium sp. SYSU T00001]|uniref:nucleotide sugar dehydrogenase n=1 Tax=Homoserinimonas sedimenticola TaxID=2986805 RepID=UPI0022355521|nr:nucleotide sugar dehydrogenase [Salinibacterium sedimenticola]MCW4385044.1 nucleotide sugar dehydrogenase [Salinibacterium sedimenticola]